MWDAEQRQMCAHTIKNNVTHATIETGLSLRSETTERERERESRTDNKLRKKQFKYSTVHCAWHSLLGLRDFSKWQCNDDWAVR